MIFFQGFLLGAGWLTSSWCCLMPLWAKTVLNALYLPIGQIQLTAILERCYVITKSITNSLSWEASLIFSSRCSHGMVQLAKVNKMNKPKTKNGSQNQLLGTDSMLQFTAVQQCKTETFLHAVQASVSRFLWKILCKSTW